MGSTSESIRQFLSIRGQATAVEISLRLGRTPADVRRHIELLVKAGWVEKSGVQTPIGQGRPAALYGPGPLMRAPGLAPLANALLCVLLSAHPSGVRAALDELAASLTGPQPPKSPNLTNRLIQAIRRLNELGYLARWEARPGGPRILLKRFPFQEVRSSYPQEMELLNKLIIEKLVDGEIIQEGSPDVFTRTYLLKANS